MKVSLNWAKYNSNVDIASIGADELVKKIGAQLGAVDEVENWGARYDGILVVKVIACEKHADADKLHVCRVDDGGVAKDVERGDDGLVQVVCGAPNVKTGMSAVWLPPGSTVPSSFGDAEPFVLSARDLRGVVSNGMLASPSELGLGDSHDGLLEINTSDVGEDLVKPGTPFKNLYGLDDVVIDCENKMFTHRPDCFGILGVARELAGIQNLAFESPSWYKNVPTFEQATELPLEVKIETDLVPRFMAVAIKNVTIASSPMYMQAGLVRVGIRPINNIVDITNWLMHLTGQPLHAFDYDKAKKLSGGTTTLVARQSVKGEKLNLLNGKQLEFDDDKSVVIATDSHAVGVGGVMGGADTEVDENTKNIIIECANFDMYSIRKTAMKYGLFTDAVTRFNKGQSPLQNDRVMAETLKLVNEIAGGKQASNVIDITSGSLELLPKISVSADFINRRLGTKLSLDEIKTYLNNVEIESEVSGAQLVVQPPFWRRDIMLAEDIVEEVGRLHGYDKLPIELPVREAKATTKNKELEFKANLARILASFGANEMLTYSFVHESLLTKASQKPENSFAISNALSPELQFYRQTITPNLLDKVHSNNKAGFDEFAIFEIGKTHNKIHGNDEDKLPGEINMTAFVYAANAKAASNKEGAAFYQVRKYLDSLSKSLGLTFFYSKIDENPDYPVTAPFDFKRSAYVKTSSGDFIGIVGEYKQGVMQKFKLPKYVAGFEVGTIDLMNAAAKAPSSYKPLSRYPSIEQDISLSVKEQTLHGDLRASLTDEIEKIIPQNCSFSLDPLDIYKENSKTHMAFRLKIASFEQTLKAGEVNELLSNAAQSLDSKFNAVRI